MKKIFLALIAAVFTLVSCDMDKSPEGSTTDTDALSSVEKCKSFRNGLYTYMRSVTTGGFIILSEIQLDDFHAVRGNGNRLMDFYNGNILATTGEVASIYGGYYSVIAGTNFLINGVEERIETGFYPQDSRHELNRYLGEAYFIRAFSYSNLADKFCGSYKHAEDLDKEGLGLSLQTTYAPTGDNTTYPGRSSLRATYNLILSDISKADSLLSLYEENYYTEPMAMSQYITSDVAKALKARVYLNMGYDEEAAKTAESLINTERYPLATYNDYRKMWTDDSATEILWRVQMDLNHQGSATGSNFLSQTQNPDYIPTNTTAYLYSDNDIRLLSCLGDAILEESGTKVYISGFTKYPGNPELYATGASSNYANMSKPFRASELYLIVAEGYANIGQEELANFYLSSIQSQRIRNYRNKTYSGVDLIAEIYDERHRELLGEGFRMADLKRWNMGFTRGETQYGADAFVYSLNSQLSYEADDYRLVWPIPKDELDANPQIKGQQNPGY